MSDNESSFYAKWKFYHIIRGKPRVKRINGCYIFCLATRLYEREAIQWLEKGRGGADEDGEEQSFGSGRKIFRVDIICFVGTGRFASVS